MDPNQLAKKVVVVGDSGAGKTSIIERLTEKRFTQNSPTVGTSTKQYTATALGGKPVNMVIWDTAGQEQYQSLSSVYFRDSVAALIVFDLTKENQTPRILEWINRYVEVCPEGFIAVAGNKADLVQYIDQAKTQCVDMEEDVGKNISIVSAQNGEGVTELFNYIATNIASSTVGSQSVQLSTTGYQKSSCC